MLPAPPERVRGTLLDVGAQPSWRRDVDAVEAEPDGRAWTERTRPGERIRFELVQAIANDVARIPAGEVREIRRLRNELARRNDAAATCPVTTAIYLRCGADWIRAMREAEAQAAQRKG